jgi:hypothetical protein
MKKLILLILALSSFPVSAQELSLGNKGIESVIFEFEGQAVDEIYDKTLKWIRNNYTAPRDVITTTVQNEKINVNGMSEKLFWYKVIGSESSFKLDHSLFFTFDKSSVKLDCIIYMFIDPVTGEKAAINPGLLFNKDGSLNTTDNYEHVVPGINSYLAAMSNEYVNYITGIEPSKVK